MAKITLWEGDVGLAKDEKYKFSNVMVHVYQQSKHLSKPKEGDIIAEIANISELEDENFTTVGGAEVIGVMTLESCHDRELNKV